MKILITGGTGFVGKHLFENSIQLFDMSHLLEVIIPTGLGVSGVISYNSKIK